MVQEKPGRKSVGRPESEFDKKMFENLCQCWCTKDEIESIFRTDIRILEKWVKRTYFEDFDTVYKRFSDGGKASLRRTQLRIAQNHAGMAIFLGKQKLGQKDNPEEIKEFNGKLGELLDVLKEKYQEKKAEEEPKE